MRRSFALLVALVLVAASASCGGGGPTTPSETRIVSLSGDINFGEVGVGQLADRTLRVTNTGNSPLTVDAIVGSSDLVQVFFTSLQTARTIQPGTTLDVTLQFRPLEARQYLGIGNVQGNMTSGTNSFSVSGIGVIR